MKPPVFEYQAPESLGAALELMSQSGDDAKLLAGGQSLVPAMNFRVMQPSILVDLNPLSNLSYIRRSEDGRLSLGAMTRLRSLEKHPQLASWSPLLHEAIPYIAHPQIRNRGTLGGSMAHADPAAELPVVAQALEVRLKLQRASGERWINAADFFLGMFTTVLAPDEILVEIEIPPQSPRTGVSFQEFARRHGDYALMGVAAVVCLDEGGLCQEARLVYLNAGDGPVTARQAAELLRGHEPSADLIEAAAELAASREIDPFGNVHASSAYQRHLARVLTRRVLLQAFERARATNAPLGG